MSITEDYVSYEVAKLLKEKGFEGICDYAYSNKGNYFEVDRSNFDEVYCLRPTHQMAMAWLREKNISIEPSVVKPHYWVYTIYEILNNKVKELYNDGGFDSYKEAVEAALKYSLENLI